MVQQVKAFPIKTADLCSIIRSHTVEGELTPVTCHLNLVCGHWDNKHGTHAHVCANTHTHK